MTKGRDLLHLHFIVVILGFTAIIGKLISESAESIVFWRLLYAVLGLLAYFLWQKKIPLVPPKKIATFLGIGVVIAIHWVTFFSAIKLSNISVTLVCLSTSTLFTSLFEPLFFRRRVSEIQIFLGFLIVLGVYLIFRFEADYWQGITVALISAVTAALFTVLTKQVSSGYNPTVVSMYELIGGFLALVLFHLVSGRGEVFSTLPNVTDLLWLIVLGVICTSYAYTASVKVMRSLSAYLIVLTINLEPIYGILLGVAIFGESEVMTPGFYVGALLIFLAVIIYPVLLQWQKTGKYKFLKSLKIE